MEFRAGIDYEGGWGGEFRYVFVDGDRFLNALRKERESGKL